MKRVSFEVAKAIKKAGFPQDSDIYYYDSYGKLNVYESYSTMCLHNGYRCPFYLEVWCWLWREKKCYIQPELCFRSNEESSFVCIDKINNIALVKSSSEGPEEAIIDAIEFLVENDLIK